MRIEVESCGVCPMGRMEWQTYQAGLMANEAAEGDTDALEGLHAMAMSWGAK